MTRESPLLEKWKLVRAASHDKSLSTGDLAVLIALCDRYGSKYDRDAPALAGHALLAAMTGLTRRATIASTQRLQAAGYIRVVELGSGTRGTRYGLNFLSGEASDTTNAQLASGELDDTTGVNATTPLEAPSGEADFTESPPTESRLQAGIQIGGTECAAPTAPPVPGADAPAQAGTAQDGGFGRLWTAYGWSRRRKEALAVWKRLAPDADTAEAVIAAAEAWKGGAGTIQRMSLDRWLTDGRYLEVPPRPYEPKTSRKAARPANDNKPASTTTWKAGDTHYVTLERVENIESDAEKLVRLHLKDADKGHLWTHDLLMFREADGYRNYGNRMRCDAQKNDVRYSLVSNDHAFTDWPDAVGARFRLRLGEDGDVWHWKAA